MIGALWADGGALRSNFVRHYPVSKLIMDGLLRTLRLWRAYRSPFVQYRTRTEPWPVTPVISPFLTLPLPMAAFVLVQLDAPAFEANAHGYARGEHSAPQL